MTERRNESPSNRMGAEIQQKRARATREKLIEAASTLFWANGYHSTQTPAIAAAAGVSVGTFYRYFGDKGGVFRAIARRELVATHQDVLALLTPERFVGKGRRDAITSVLRALVAAVARHPERHRLFLEMALRDEELAAIKAPLDEEIRSLLVQIIAAVSTRERIVDPEATALMMHTALSECALILAGVHGAPPVSRERGIAALGEMVDNALFGVGFK